MTAKDTDIPVTFLAECFELAPETPSGLRWRHRPLEHFASAGAWATWNTRFAGTSSQHTNSDGYAEFVLTFAGRRGLLKAHRIVWALTHGRWPHDQIDHENGVEAGDGIGNLREATNAQNGQNRKVQRNNTSGYPGVGLETRRGKWKAQIVADGRKINLGYFDTFEHACQARIGAESVLHPFRRKSKPLDPATIIPDGALVTGVYSFTGRPKRITYTYLEAQAA